MIGRGGKSLLSSARPGKAELIEIEIIATRTRKEHVIAMVQLDFTQKINGAGEIIGFHCGVEF